MRYQHDYYETSRPNIIENEFLRLPQIESYVKTKFHFDSGNKTHAVIVVPTGVGKTGIMALLPYGISKGRVLIIAPYSPIRDSITRALDPMQSDNFYVKHKVFSHNTELPKTIVYDGSSTPDDVLERANLVIVNIHKLQDRLSSSLINRLPDDFFDVVIIDEAHHSPARTWVNTVQYFYDAKVVKVTATPYRTDCQDIAGDLIYKYSLGQAMAANYVKSLQKFDYIPEKLTLTMDDDPEKQYTIQELLDMELKDEDWISRSVALSEDCSRSVVRHSIEALNEKKRLHNIPHKIIAIASNIRHAELICRYYEEEGLGVALIHSDLDQEEQDSVFADIRNHRVEVVVHVSMLGEGYDHSHLSIAAIFRAFRNPLPYSQFIGRILRVIQDEDTIPSDNVGVVIAHENLYLDQLWEYYRREMQESEIIKHLKDEDMLKAVEPPPEETGERESDIGQAFEEGEGRIRRTAYLTTEMIRAQEAYQEDMDEKIQTIMETLKVDEERARSIIIQTESEDEFAMRPDLYYQYTRQGIDDKIKEELVPEILSTLDVDFKAKTLSGCALFDGKFGWIRTKDAPNDAMLVMYYNNYLRLEIGKKRDDWSIDDCKIALKLLPQRTEIVYEIIKEYIGS